MPLSNKERQRRWMEKNRALHNLRRRNARKGSSLGEKEAAVESNRSRTEMARNEISGSVSRAATCSGETTASTVPHVSNGGDQQIPPPRPSVAELREMMSKASKKPATEPPASVDTRSAKDVIGGIYRNDNGGVISKFAWEKLQKMKAHAKENNFEIDEYSQ